MKNLFFFLASISLFSCVNTKISKKISETEKISTIDFVQVLNVQKDEVLYYYENNWKMLRINAVKKNYIHSYQMLATEFSDDAPFDYMLITTYANRAQYDQREIHFDELIQANGPLKLLNSKEPKDFRKTIFGKDSVRHL